MNLRNIAIIAHVDHGKTTLVDKLLQQSGTYRDNQRQVERAMDSNDLERERGITILAKCTSVHWEDTQINIVDTPGHADFGGEVERILSMVDGVIVLVDAAEGPMPQTKFVVSKALKLGLKPIVAINKVDRPDARVTEVVNEVFDLFAALDATDEQLDFPILYGSGKNGWMGNTPDASHDDGMKPLFELVIKHVAPPVVEEGPFRLLGTILEANPYLGRIITGRITSGSVKPNQSVKVLVARRQGGRDRTYHENSRFPRPRAQPWNSPKPATSSPSPGCRRAPSPIPSAILLWKRRSRLSRSIRRPFRCRSSSTIRRSPAPKATRSPSRMIRDRLLREAEGNVALKVVEASDKDAMEVSGRGELQLAILIETMRREGFELSVSRPRVVLTKDEQRPVAGAGRGSRHRRRRGIPASSCRR